MSLSEILERGNRQKPLPLTLASSYLVTLRDLVYTHLVAEKTANEFSNNDFTIAKTYLPFQRLEDIPDDGKLWIIGLASDDEKISRKHSYTKEIPLQFLFQKRLEGNPTDETTELDSLVFLEEQIRKAVSDSVLPSNTFQWLRTSAMKDENETPFNYTGLREANVFEAFFISSFHTIVSE